MKDYLGFDAYRPLINAIIKQKFQDRKRSWTAFEDLMPYIEDEVIKDLQRTKIFGTKIIDLFRDAPKDHLNEFISSVVQLYVDKIISQEPDLDKLGEFLRTGYAIVVTGAGLSSEAGLPITEDLNDIAYTALCYGFPSAKEDKKKYLDRKGKLKPEVWDMIDKDDKCYDYFVKCFKNKCDSTYVKPADSHNDLLYFYDKGRFLCIIDANWDDLIERAYRELHEGRDIPTTVFDTKISGSGECGRLWKVYGSIAHLEIGKLVLPTLTKKLPNSLISCIQQYNEKGFPYILLTIGYSGKWEKRGHNIIEQLKPFVEPRKICHIRPEFKEKFSKNVFIGTARYILKKIRSSFDMS